MEALWLCNYTRTLMYTLKIVNRATINDELWWIKLRKIKSSINLINSHVIAQSRQINVTIFILEAQSFVCKSLEELFFKNHCLQTVYLAFSAHESEDGIWTWRSFKCSFNLKPPWWKRRLVCRVFTKLWTPSLYYSMQLYCSRQVSKSLVEVNTCRVHTLE